MVVYTCVCCKFETNHKNKYTSMVEDDRYTALEEKYKALEEKYKVLEEKYKALEEKYKEEKYKEDDKEEKYKEDDKEEKYKEDDKEKNFLKDQVDIMEDKVYNVADMLSKSQYQTPNLEELILDFHCDDYERNPVDGMIQVLNRMFYYVFIAELLWNS